MKKNRNTCKVEFFVTLLYLFLRGGGDEGLNSDFGQLYTKNYKKIKSGFTLAFSSLTVQAFTIHHFSDI